MEISHNFTAVTSLKESEEYHFGWGSSAVSAGVALVHSWLRKRTAPTVKKSCQQASNWLCLEVLL